MPRLYVSAHEDDDLIFMSPCLARDIESGIGVWTVYLTAGDAGIGDVKYWRGREEGERSAYIAMGAKGWASAEITVAGRTLHALETTDGTVRLIFLRLPDGGCLGEGCKPSLALERMWSGERISAVDGSATYDWDELIGSLVEIATMAHSDLISGHDPNGYYVGCDHTDHYYSGLAAREMARLLKKPLRLFRGYCTDLAPTNVYGDDLTRKHAAFKAYSAHDRMIAKPLDTMYTVWLARCYPRPG